MSRVIVLTAEQAAQVRGDTPDGFRLTPIPHGDRFIISVGVLTDAAHQDKWEFLASLPQEDVEVPGGE